MKAFLKSFLDDESGATAIEYGLVAALIAVVITGAITTLGVGVRDTLFNKIAAAMP
jgi:pilus assembly protein Flp/PilA